MEIRRTNTYAPKFEARLITANKKAEQTISKALRSHYKNELNQGLDELHNIYPKTVVTLRINSTDEGVQLVAKNTTNGQIIKSEPTKEKHLSKEITELIKRLVSESKDNINTFWNGIK